MCGIVGYFGRAGNSLTRLLTAMSAINYRAPDSTGVAVFGDDIEPIRTRKALGSVGKLAELLAQMPIYPNHPEMLRYLWLGENVEDTLSHQSALLKFEGLSLEMFRDLAGGRRDYASFDLLFAPDQKIRLEAGLPGRPGHLPVLFIQSRSDLVETIRRLTIRFDLSFTVIHSLIRKYLQQTIAQKQDHRSLGIDAEAILDRFDRIFEKLFLQEKLPRPVRLDYGGEKHPYLDRYVWRYLKATPICVPPDYDRDAVRCMFRFLDAALGAYLHVTPATSRKLDRRLKKAWPGVSDTSDLNWRTLYLAEKGANVYGRAASVALAYLQEIFISDDPGQLTGFEPELPVEPGISDPLTLAFFAQPIVSHGRWAIQSSVTVKNAHPFLDASGHRAIALNGQFDAEIEAQIRKYLDQVEGVAFRSDNSSEYFSLLWGCYFDNLLKEKQRYDAVLKQTEEELTAFAMGSQLIDFSEYRHLKGKSGRQIDELAFLESARRMAQKGGQIAVIGVSLYSPRCLYVAAHNRPVFIVRRVDLEDFMVVSDVNAAMGLFPQGWIYNKILELNRLRKQHEDRWWRLQKDGASKKILDQCAREQDEDEKRFLSDAFPVMVYPLEGEELFARIRSEYENGQMVRRIDITDFELNPFPEIRPFQTELTPAWVRKDLFGSFFETHLHEIPERIRTILNTYLPDDAVLPLFNLKENVLKRRFGNGFVNLERIILAGMGSAANIAYMARGLFRMLVPQVEVAVIKPVEVINVTGRIVPEKDLVVLLSWSSTTAEMIELARALRRHRIVMIGITEKVFADMALIADASGGIIPVLSGEEVTISAIKSPPCMMFCLNLLGGYLSAKIGKHDTYRRLLPGFRTTPDAVNRVLENESVKAFITRVAQESAGSRCSVIFDDLRNGGVGREVAMKLEETSWTSVGKCLDYEDLYNIWFHRDINRNLIIVNATIPSRLPEARNVIKRLYMGNIAFVVVTIPNAAQEEMAFYCRDRILILPQVIDCFQSFVDLTFYYLFSFAYGRSHGRKPDEFPRNRAKSVTISRSRPSKMPTAEREWMILKKRNQTFVNHRSDFQPLSMKAQWKDIQDWVKNYYTVMINLARAVSSRNPIEKLFRTGADLTNRLQTVSHCLTREGNIVLVYTDRQAQIAAESLAYQWRRFLDAGIRVTEDPANIHHGLDETLFIFMGISQPNNGRLSRSIKHFSGTEIWIGSDLDHHDAELFDKSGGYLPLRWDVDTPFIGSDLLYAGACIIFESALENSEPEKASILRSHFKQMELVVQSVLTDPPSIETIRRAMADNRDYPTGFIIGPPCGIGMAWTDVFQKTGAMALQHHMFGESAHGPLVTVDHRVDKKFIRLESRKDMIRLYGKGQVEQWESRYLNDESIDHFLETSQDREPSRIESPFFAEGSWYLPVITPGYDPAQDNLIFIDASRESTLNAAFDELSAYGCRNARIVLITQKAFEKRKQGFHRHPVSHMISLPCPYDGAKDVPISGFLLPFVMKITAMATASAASKTRNIDVRPVDEGSLFHTAFGFIGDTLIRHHMGLQNMGPFLIETLRCLAPLVKAVKGSGRYEVLRIREASQLQQMADELRHPEIIPENFQSLQKASPDTAYFLMRLDPESVKSDDSEVICDILCEDTENQWTEPAGNTWKVLNYQVLGVRESQNERPLLMLPMMKDSAGWLLCVHADYILWDHDAILADQLPKVLCALGKEMRFHRHIAPRYLKITSRFNEQTAMSDMTWDDRLIGLVQIPLMMKRSSSVIARTIIRRMKQIQNITDRQGRSISAAAIPSMIENVWLRIQSTDVDDDEKRWKMMYMSFKQNH